MSNATVSHPTQVIPDIFLTDVALFSLEGGALLLTDRLKHTHVVFIAS